MKIVDKAREEYFNLLNSPSNKNKNTETRAMPSEDSTVVLNYNIPNLGLDEYIDPNTTHIGTNGLNPISPEYAKKVLNPKFFRADLEPEAFDRLIWQKGFTAKWEKATFCTCLDERSGQPNSICPYCGGKGYLYIDEKYTRALVTSISGKMEQEGTGLDDKGSLYLSSLSVDTVGFRDKFTFPEFVVRFSDIVKKGEDIVKYPIRDIIGIYSKGEEVNPSHYSITIGTNKVVWSDEVIPEGERYSVLYLSNPVYIVLVPMHELRGTYLLKNGDGKDYFVRLPSQFQIKREDLISNLYAGSI